MANALFKIDKPANEPVHAYARVNASPTPLRMPTHDPCIHNTLPVHPGAQENNL